jgi:hypothetical protein
MFERPRYVSLTTDHEGSRWWGGRTKGPRMTRADQPLGLD